MTNSRLFKMAHAMATGMKSRYPEIDYRFQFSLCLKHLKTSKEEVNVATSKKFDYKAAEKGIREYERWIDECEKSNHQIIKTISEGKWICKTEYGFEYRHSSENDIKKSFVKYAWKKDGSITKSAVRPIEKSVLYPHYLETLNK